MIRIIAAAVALVALSTAATAQVTASIAPAHPVLRANAVVTGDLVRIGDLVDHAGVVANIPIFRAPDLGATGTVAADAVAEAVKPHALIGLDTAGLSEVVVTRASRAIGTGEIESLIERALATQYALGKPQDISLVFDRELRTLYVEADARGDVRLDDISYEARSGRFEASVDYPTSAASRGHMKIKGRATATIETIELMRTLSRGEIVTRDDIAVQRRPRRDINGTVLTDASQAVGLAARGVLSANRPLRAADLMKPEVIQRNESVTLIYRVPGIMLTVRGKAAEGGAEGDIITVVNEQTKRPVQGVVTGPGRVEVGGGNRRVAANVAAAEAR